MHTSVIAKTQQHPETLAHYELMKFQSHDFWVSVYIDNSLYRTYESHDNYEDAKKEFDKLRGHLPVIFNRYSIKSNLKKQITRKPTTVSKIIEASKWEIFLYLITNGRKGRLYKIEQCPCVIWQTPPHHFNCRCTMSEQDFKREYLGDFKPENPNE